MNKTIEAEAAAQAHTTDLATWSVTAAVSLIAAGSFTVCVGLRAHSTG